MMSVVAVALGWYAVRDHWAARGRWDHVVRSQPFDASAWNNWANAQHDVNQALDGYRRAAALVPSQAYFRESFGRALEATRSPENYTLALAQYKAALREAPNRAINALAIGRILYLQDKPADALEWFKKALQIEPRYWECDLWMARCLYRLGRSQSARRVLIHLKTRRDDYFNLRNRIAQDLPSSNESSAYDRIILAYDECVRIHDLSLLQRRP